MKKWLFLLVFLIPFSVKAYNITLTIDENGNISYTFPRTTVNDVATADYINNSYEINGDTLLLKSSTDRYYIDTNKSLTITANSDIDLYMIYASADIVFESDYTWTLSYVGNPTKNNTITFNNTDTNGAYFFDFKEIAFNNSTATFGCIQNQNYDAKLYVSNSTVTCTSTNYLSFLKLKDSDCYLREIIGKDFSFDIEDSTFDFYYIGYRNDAVGVCKAKNSTIKNGTIMTPSNMNFDITINLDGTTTDKLVIYYAKIYATDCIIDFCPMFCICDIKDSSINIFSSSVNVIGWDLDNCELTGTGLRLQTNGPSDIVIDSYTIKNTNIHLTDYFEILSGNYTVFFDNVNMTAGNTTIHNFSIKNSTFNVERFLSTYCGWDGSIPIIENSTINSTRFDFTYSNTTYKMINTKINTGDFLVNGTLNAKKTKVKSHNSMVFYLGEFVHNYFLVDMDDNNTTGYAYVRIMHHLDGKYISTNINNDLIEYSDYASYSDQNVAEYKNSTSVLLRDKVNITFKVENGTWEDGTTDDKKLELYSFDKLSLDQIPTNMVARDGYENGSWDSELMYDELNDDYVFTYSYKKKGLVASVKGVIEELKENPKTGVFNHTLFVLSLLLCSIYLYRVLKTRSYFK